MTTWIFQGNPDRHDTDTYVSRDYPRLYLSFTSRGRLACAVGDRVYLWRAKGRRNHQAGIIARGVVVEPATARGDVQHPEYLGDDLWREQRDARDDILVGVAVDHVRLTVEGGMLTRELISGDHVLKGLRILKMPQGTNYIVEADHAKRLADLWTGSHDVPDDETLESASEARVFWVHHRMRERARGLVNAAKARFVRRHGHLFCELCGFDFRETYGALGEGVVEVHHTKALADMSPNEETHIDDLLIVCSNCHTVLHRGADARALETLRAMGPTLRPLTKSGAEFNKTSAERTLPGDQYSLACERTSDDHVIR